MHVIFTTRKKVKDLKFLRIYIFLNVIKVIKAIKGDDDWAIKICFCFLFLFFFAVSYLYFLFSVMSVGTVDLYISILVYSLF